jgi:hypothetical protein
MPAEHRPPPDHLVSNQRSKRKQEPQGGGQKGDCQRRTETDEAKVQNLVWLIVCALRIMVGTHKHREDGPEQSEDAAHANVRCTEQERSRCRGASRDPFEEAIHPNFPDPYCLYYTTVLLFHSLPQAKSAGQSPRKAQRTQRQYR